jgi:hypothetical protein
MEFTREKALCFPTLNYRLGKRNLCTTEKPQLYSPHSFGLDIPYKKSAPYPPSALAVNLGKADEANA